MLRELVSAAVLADAFAWRAQGEARGRVTNISAFPATLFLMAGLNAILPGPAVSTVVFMRCVQIDLTAAHATLAIAPVIACYRATMLRRPRGSRARLHSSLLATTLLAALIFHESLGQRAHGGVGIEGCRAAGRGIRAA